MRFYICIVLGLCLFISVAYAKETDPPALHKGINVASWLANARRQPLYERDFIQIKKVGFDHVRLPVDPALLRVRAEEEFIPLDNAIKMATAHGLAVILDIHPSDEYEDTQDLEGLWDTLAKRYKSYSAHSLVFELLNEPHFYHTEEQYNGLVRSVVATIRKYSPTRTVIIGAPHGSSIEGLQFIKPLDDANVIYAFHFYEPYIITHQGVHRMFEGKMLRFFAHLPYPASLATHDASFYAVGAPKRQQAQQELDEYTKANWNAELIQQRIAVAAQWAQEHHVRIICGEFGVLRNHIDADSRYRWIEDTRTALESFGIGWELWDYTDLDGITKLIGDTNTDPVDGSIRFNNPEKGNRKIEPEAIQALGLKQ